MEPSTSSFDDFLSTHATSLAELHLRAAEVMGKKRVLTLLDERRQKVREAERILRKKDAPEETWVSFGQTKAFIKLPTKDAIELSASDRKMIDEEMDRTRKELEKSTDALLKLENKQSLAQRGFNLKNILS